jgi:hypothetical protein
VCLCACVCAVGLCDGAGALIAFFLVPWIGAQSDIRGRRFGLTATAVCGAINIFVLAMHYSFDLSTYWTYDSTHARPWFAPCAVLY